jgi:protein-arginine kinase activator protein McsA
MLTEKSQKSLSNFICTNCDYYTSKKSDFEKHKLTLKHKNVDKMLTNIDTPSTKIAKNSYECDCGKKYTHRQSLSVHKKKCTNNCKNNELILTNIIKLL